MKVLARIEAAMAAGAAQGRTVVDCSPLAVHLSPLPGWVHSLAIPTSEVSDWTAAVGDMVDAFDEAQRVPRIEYFAGLHPTLHPALDAAGLDLDMEAPVMVRSGPSVLAPPTIEAEPLRTDDDLEAFVANQSIAYGGDAFDTSWVCRLRDGLRNRTTTGATVTEGGEVVAGATVAWVDDIAELAGVWTLPTHRRQGLAAAVCAAAIADIGSDTVLWLSAGPGTGTLYQRLGFRAIGTQLNFIRR